MGYSPWGGKRVGHDLASEQQKQLYVCVYVYIYRERERETIYKEQSHSSIHVFIYFTLIIYQKYFQFCILSTTLIGCSVLFYRLTTNHFLVLRHLDMCVCQFLSCVRHFATPWTVAHQVPMSMQEQWSGLPFPPPGNLHLPLFISCSLALGLLYYL